MLTPGPCARAFTLVEMLAVISIALILLGIVVPAVVGLTRGQGMTANTAAVSDLIEQARQAAMAQNTFVWLGIGSTERDSGPALALAILVASSGQATDLANNHCRQLVAPRVLKNITLDGSEYLTLNGVDVTNNADFANSTFSFALKLPGNVGNTIFQAIEFKPDGELSLGAPARRYVGIGLAGVPASSSARPSTAGIQISLLTGQHTIFRP